MNTPQNPSDTLRLAADSTFAATRWTLVLRARGASAESRAALSELCEAYYAPVLAFLRREGRNEETARELTQEFFSQLLAEPRLGGVDPGRGRFRSYLLGAVKNFLAQQRQRANAAKRGGGQSPLSIDIDTHVNTTAELQIPDPAAAVPDTWFDRQWATTLVDRAVAVLAAEAESEGKTPQFAVLKPWLLGEVPALSQADAALQLGLSEGAVKVAVHRLRKRFRDVVKAQIAQTVDEPGQVQEELRYLVEVLAQSAPVPG
ncbi:MAG TPA: sigma-70 family RNA polymerase sigma factor [Candidatus Paceibacterota bacterium]|nr:sigma-70 family RNA polymerase sigma factor [Verrucomicrobiota bacterium]HRY51164.1 sigma-70 family RNA polymerase sigma factor [Candidatus Paceibacterota bacterium]